MILFFITAMIGYCLGYIEGYRKANEKKDGGKE